jgi:hypothetical protein
LFLQWLCDESSECVCYALGLLQKQSRPLSWSDVPDSFVQRDPPVLVELAWLFAERDDAPISLWLACAQHCETIYREQPEALASVANGLVRCSAQAPVLTATEIGLVRESLATVEGVLPVVDHRSYMELKSAGFIPDPRGKTSYPGGAFARIWTALVRLTPNYDPANCQLRPRYR